MAMSREHVIWQKTQERSQAALTGSHTNETQCLPGTTTEVGTNELISNVLGAYHLATTPVVATPEGLHEDSTSLMLASDYNIPEITDDVEVAFNDFNQMEVTLTGNNPELEKH